MDIIVEEGALDLESVPHQASKELHVDYPSRTVDPPHPLQTGAEQVAFLKVSASQKQLRDAGEAALRKKEEREEADKKKKGGDKKVGARVWVPWEMGELEMGGELKDGGWV